MSYVVKHCPVTLEYQVINIETLGIQSAWTKENDARDTANRLNSLTR